jgi:hypothetical protein
MGSETRREILKRLINEYASERAGYPDKELFPGITSEAHKELVRRWQARVDASWEELQEAINRYVPAAPREKVSK